MSNRTMATLRFTKQQRLLLLGAIFVGSGMYLGVQLDMMGAAGEHHAQIWDFIIALFGIAASIMTAVLQLRQPSRPKASSEAAAVEARTPIMNPVVVLCSVGIALLAFAIPASISRVSFDHWQQEHVTTAVKVSNNNDLRDGSIVRITLPETKHRELTITLKLTSLIDTGSCVSPASLIITPTHSGNDEAPLAAIRSGEAKHINIRPQTATQLLVRVDLSAEPTCRVKLNVAEAIYAR